MEKLCLKKYATASTGISVRACERGVQGVHCICIMEATKAAAYPASSVRFSFFHNIFILILEVFSCGDQ